MPSEAEQMIAAGEPAQALQLLQTQVKKQPADVKLRIFLFQLLCVLGQWPRAATQLEVCGELDALTLAMVNTYREALKCELVREKVFAGTTTPLVLGRPQEWVARLVEAMQAGARGESALAAQLRAQAFEMAPAAAGSLNDEAFEWVADADSRLGPVLEVIVNGRYAWVPFASLSKLTIEAPEDLRDFVWAPAHLEFPNGGDSVALVPARYPLGAGAGGAEQLARSTDWEALADGQYAGRGQRVLVSSAAETGLLAVRELVMHGGDVDVADAAAGGTA